ncbi:hypothetical protein D3C86_2061460 [compost metagenome]
MQLDGHGESRQALAHGLLQLAVAARQMDVGELAEAFVAEHLHADGSVQFGHCRLIDPANGIETQGRLEGLAYRGERDGVDDPGVLGHGRTFGNMRGGMR